MYTYADESGNTGSNLLDVAQPHYLAGAIMSLESLDTKYGKLFNEYAKSKGHTHLHAGAMGMGNLVDIFPTLERFVRKDTLRFFLGVIDKKWFILVKFFDTLFDPEDNRAVARHLYWIAPLRYVILLKLHHITRDEDLADIWQAVIASDFESAKTQVTAALNRILGRVNDLPDERSREIVKEAFTWAIVHTDELGIKIRGKKLILNHYPNVAMLTPLLAGVQKQAEYWKTTPKVITHDQSSQFQSTWRDLHKTLAKAKDLEFSLVGGPTHKLGIDSDSTFMISDSRQSAGIQFIDIVLWLWKRISQNAEVPHSAHSLMSRVFRHADPYEMSYRSTVNLAEKTLAPALAYEPSDGDIEKGRNMLAQFEEQRLSRMNELEIGHPPVQQK